MTRKTACENTCGGGGRNLAHRIVVLLILAGLLVVVPGGLTHTADHCTDPACHLWAWQSALFGTAVFLLMLSLFARSRSRHPPHRKACADDDPCFNLHTLSSAALGGLGAGLLCYLFATLLLPDLHIMGGSNTENTLSLYLSALGIIMTLVTIGVLWTSDRAIALMKETEQRVETHANEKLHDMEDRARRLEQSDERQWQRLQLQNLALLLIHQNQKQLSILQPKDPQYQFRNTLDLLYAQIRRPRDMLRYLANYYPTAAFELLDEEKELLCALETFYRDFPEETEQDGIEPAWFDQIDRNTRFRDQCNKPAPVAT